MLSLNTKILGIVGLVTVAGVFGLVYNRSQPPQVDSATSAVAPVAKQLEQDISNVQAKVITTKEPVKDGRKTYLNSNYGLSFKYPEKWQAEERNPSATSLESDKVGLSVWLVDASVASRPEVAIVTVSSKNLQSTVSTIRETVDGRIPELKQTVNGKQFVKFEIPQPEGTTREWYLLENKTKTYRIETFNELSNSKRSGTYAADIKQLVSSVEVQ